MSNVLLNKALSHAALCAKYSVVLDSPVYRDSNKCQDRSEDHAIVTENPQTTHHLPKRPEAEHSVDGVESHGDESHQEISYS